MSPFLRRVPEEKNPDPINKRNRIFIFFETKRFLYKSKNPVHLIMKKAFLVLLIIAIAMTGIVSANISTLPVGESGFYDVTSSPSGAAVSVDGTSSGTTPTTATVIVGASGHTIAVNKAGI